MAIQETTPIRRNADFHARTKSPSDIGRIAAILLVVMAEAVALCTIPGLTTSGVFGIFAVSYAAGILVLAV